MSGLAELDERVLSEALRERGLDGWLVYDFHGVNPIAQRLLSAHGMVTRRVFLWLPAVGPAQLIAHNIDRPALGDFPGEVDVYTTWQQLHHRLQALVRGRRIAMEVSPENAVPYLDLVPSGLVELLTRMGAVIIPSDALVTQFAACWSMQEQVDHRHAAEAIAAIARDTIARVVGQVGAAREAAVQAEVLTAMQRAGLSTEEPPIVGFGPNAADPHYEPRAGADRLLQAGDVVLVDLWAKATPTTVWADQTWMGVASHDPNARIVEVWNAVRDARDAAVQRLRDAFATGARVSGGDLDRVARGVIESRGFGEAFVHRTGHSIEAELHGAGPHLDDFETHDTRELLIGVGFSIEPGVYLTGEFGVRSEVNVLLAVNGPEVSPVEPQMALIVPR
jgi:Xaa-Pro aminopeptidase